MVQRLSYRASAHDWCTSTVSARPRQPSVKILHNTSCTSKPTENTYSFPFSLQSQASAEFLQGTEGSSSPESWRLLLDYQGRVTNTVVGSAWKLKPFKQQIWDLCLDQNLWSCSISLQCLACWFWNRKLQRTGWSSKCLVVCETSLTCNTYVLVLLG